MFPSIHYEFHSKNRILRKFLAEEDKTDLKQITYYISSKTVFLVYMEKACYNKKICKNINIVKRLKETLG